MQVTTGWMAGRQRRSDRWARQRTPVRRRRQRLVLRYPSAILGGKGADSDHFDGGAGFDTLAVLLDPATLAIEQANVAANFVPGMRSPSAA